MKVTYSFRHKWVGNKHVHAYNNILSLVMYYVISYIITSFTDILIDFSLTVKAATLIFISGHGSAFSSAKEGKSGCIFNLVKS